MTPRRYDTLRMQLIRLCQAMEHHKGLAEEMFGESPAVKTRAAPTDPSTFRVLPTIAGSRQHVRIKDRLAVVYSESPEIARDIIVGSCGTTRIVDFAAWLQEVACRRGERLNPAHGMEMRIHLQKFEEQLIYFIAFQGAGSGRVEPVPLREIEISGSGMSFPTEIAHACGEDLLVVYFLPTDPFPPLQLVAEVVRPSRRHLKGGYQTPVRYVDISEEDHQRILSYMASRHRQKSLLRVYDIGS
jgi:hypothetical protein